MQEVVDHYDSNIYEPEKAEIYVTQAVVVYYNVCTGQLNDIAIVYFVQCGESCCLKLLVY